MWVRPHLAKGVGTDAAGQPRAGVSDHGGAVAGGHCGRIILRSSSNSARPDSCLLIFLILFTAPSVLPGSSGG